MQSNERWYTDHEPPAAATIRQRIDELRAQRDVAEPGERVALQMRIYSLTQLWWLAMRGGPVEQEDNHAHVFGGTGDPVGGGVVAGAGGGDDGGPATD